MVIVTTFVLMFVLCVVVQIVAMKVGLTSTSMKFFALFQRMEHDFGKSKYYQVVHVHACT